MTDRCVAILPAGGTGSRFGTERPKQFTLLCGQPLLFHAIQALLQDVRVQAIYVALSPEYQDFLDWEAWQGRVHPVSCAGKTRSATVGNALNHLASELAPSDWVLVHDAARPCLSRLALTRLLDAVWEDAVGGLLAVPVADTLKLAASTGRVAHTVDRRQLWAAQTPQMFRYGMLRQALQGLPEATDEASAMEALGYHPLLVLGDPLNIKVTFPEDRLLAQLGLGVHQARQETT